MCAFSSSSSSRHLGDAGLVVGAEYRRAVGVDDAVADLRLDAGVRAGGVHVEGEEQGVVAVARVGGDEVARVVAADRAAEGAEPLLEFLADRLFVAGGAVDRHEVEERLEEAVAVNLIARLILTPDT